MKPHDGGLFLTVTPVVLAEVGIEKFFEDQSSTLN